MGEHQSDAGPPLLPRWFATKGPRPGWLAEYWSMILAVLSGVTVFINTVVAGQVESLTTKEWVNAAVAWITALALFLQSRYKNVGAIARWRAQVRAEEANEKLPDPPAPSSPDIPHRSADHPDQ
jgi:hypothetical protein